MSLAWIGFHYATHCNANQRTIGWIGLCSVLRPHQPSIGYMGDGFYRSKDPTNSIKVLKENLQKKITQRTKKTPNTKEAEMVQPDAFCEHTKQQNATAADPN